MKPEKEMPCATCSMRRRYDNNPKSLIARFWHWHTGFCPGWKSYMARLSDEQQADMRKKYNLK
ncbi:MAG: hypothetical protein ACI4BH_04830 [Muribaculaceae bacterium]